MKDQGLGFKDKGLGLLFTLLGFREGDLHYLGSRKKVAYLCRI